MWPWTLTFWPGDVHNTLSPHWLYIICATFEVALVLTSIWPVHFICGTHNPWHDNVSRTIFRSKGQRSHRSFEVFDIHSVAPSLFDRFTSYVGHTQPMTWWCVMHHFQVKRSKSHRLFEVFAMSVLWLRPYLTISLHMWDTHNPWSDDVSHTISGSKGQRSR